MVGTVGSFALLATLGCLAGRLLGPLLKTCPYRLSAILAALVPALGGLSQIAMRDEVHGMGLALSGILGGMGACTGVFLTGHRATLLACLGALLGGALGAALMALYT